MATTTTSTRAQLRGWVRERIAGHETVRITELKNTAIVELAGNRRFVRSMMEETMPALLAEVCREVVAETRGSLVQLGDVVVSEAEFEKRVARRASRWERWLEHSGTAHIQVMQMRKLDLLRAADERESLAEANARVAVLWRELASHLDDQQRVGDVYTAEHLERTAAQLFDTEPDVPQLTEAGPTKHWWDRRSG